MEMDFVTSCKRTPAKSHNIVHLKIKEDPPSFSKKFTECYINKYFCITSLVRWAETTPSVKLDRAAGCVNNLIGDKVLCRTFPVCWWIYSRPFMEHLAKGQLATVIHAKQTKGNPPEYRGMKQLQPPTALSQLSSTSPASFKKSLKAFICNNYE